jgi:glycosyltransferase
MIAQNNKPLKVSIITIVHNSVDTIRYAIQSVLHQDYQDIEYIIIDNCSDDGTVDIIQDQIEDISIFLSEKDDGIYDAINKGIEISNGDIIGFLHSDDILKNRHIISDIVSTIIDTGADSIYGDLEYFDRNYFNKVKRYWKSNNFHREKMKYGWMPPHPTFYTKRLIYDKYGYYNIKFHISSDYEMLLRLLYVNKISVEYIPKVLVKMQCGGASNNSAKSVLLKSLEDYKIIKKYKLSLFALVWKNLSKIPQFFLRNQ